MTLDMTDLASRSARFALAVAAVVAVAGCKATDSDKVDLGDVQVAPYSVHVLQDGPFAPGSTTLYAVAASGGPSRPESIACWYGSETTTERATGSYDELEGDWSCLVPTPAAPQPGDKLWVSITLDGAATSGSLAPRP
jgi:hypothetical protein